MNAKKAKALRKALRSNGIDVTQANYLAHNQHTVTSANLLGNVVRVTAQTNYLAPACGRALYKAMKKVNS